MDNKPVNLVVGTRCRPELEEKFNKWYDEVHIAKLFQFPGMKKVTRYKILNETNEYPTYLAIWEFESRKAYEDYEKSALLKSERQAMKEVWKGGGFETEGMKVVGWKGGGWEIEWRVSYETMKTWVK